MNPRIALTGLAALLLAGTVFAAGVSVTPGQWEMTSTTEMSMLPQPQIRSYKKCIEKSELNLDDFNMDKDSPCEFADIVIDGNTISWSISCPMQGAMSMNGQWQFTSSGDSIIGSGSMSTNTAGMQMEIKMDWEGKRLGNCP